MQAETLKKNGFTLVELIVTVSIIGLLAALMLPSLARTKASANRVRCTSNLSQIGKAVWLYAGDNNDLLFSFAPGPTNGYYVTNWASYVPLLNKYTAWNGPPSRDHTLFTCPSDTFCLWKDAGWNSEGLHLQSNANFSSYSFNAGNAALQGERKPPQRLPGVLGKSLSSIVQPAKTSLVVEGAGLDAYSWHNVPKNWQTTYNDAQANICFADSHVAYIKMYKGTNNPSGTMANPFLFDPPSGYEYRWSAN